MVLIKPRVSVIARASQIKHEKIQSPRQSLIDSLQFTFNQIAFTKGWSDSKDAVKHFMQAFDDLSKTIGSSKSNKTRSKSRSKSRSTSRSKSRSASKSKTQRKSGLKGGLGSVDYQKYMRAIGGLVIGTFDSPCNKVMSFISVGLYSVMVFQFVKAWYDNNDFWTAAADPRLSDSISDPVQYIIRHADPRLHSYQQQFFEQFKSYVTTCLQEVQQQLHIQDNIGIAEYGATAVVLALRKAFYDSTLYYRMITQPIACVLSPFMSSCDKLCE